MEGLAKGVPERRESLSRLAAVRCSENDFVPRARPIGDGWPHRTVAATVGATGDEARPRIPWESRASSHEPGP
jgi:hypothetical protein